MFYVIDGSQTYNTLASRTARGGEVALEVERGPMMKHFGVEVFLIQAGSDNF